MHQKRVNYVLGVYISDYSHMDACIMASSNKISEYDAATISFELSLTVGFL